MNLDLFTAEDSASSAQYEDAFSGWLAESGRAGRIRRKSSTDVYTHMWAAFSSWAISKQLRLVDISSTDLGSYLASRGSPDDLTARYALRLLRLVDRVLLTRARVTGLTVNVAASELLIAQPHIRFANSPDADPLLEYLSASEGKRLVVYLSSVRLSRAPDNQVWQEVRNRASVGLMLGAGLTPGEVRALTLGHVIIEGGRSKGMPWKLHVEGNGNSPARETPIAAWAGNLLAYWLTVRCEQLIPGSMVFPSTRSSGKPWGKVAQYTAAKEVLLAAGIDSVEGGSFRLRHTFALRQLRRGRTTQEVARWLGVSDPAVMARYERVITAPVDLV